MKNAGDIKYKGVGTECLATLSTAQPCGMEGKGMCRKPRFHDSQMPTPYFGGKKGEGPYVSLEDFPLKRLQVVVNKSGLVMEREGLWQA